MPITRSAIKKLRQDRKKEAKNREFEKKLKEAIKKAEKGKKPENVKNAISLIDKAVKKHIFHKNKAARIKSSLSRVVKGVTKPAEKTGKKPAKKAARTSKIKSARK